jgi:hypothetical protein
MGRLQEEDAVPANPLRLLSSGRTTLYIHLVGLMEMEFGSLRIH